MMTTPEITPAPSTESARALLPAPVAYEHSTATTVGELLAEFTMETWRAEPRFANYKSAVYLAAVRAGLIPGVAGGDRIGELDIAAAEALTLAAIRAMGQPAPDNGTAAAIRGLITRKTALIDDAGARRGLAPGWLQPKFTVPELTAITGTPADGERVPDPWRELIEARAKLAAVTALAREWVQVAPGSAVAACGDAMLAAAGHGKPAGGGAATEPLRAHGGAS